MRHTITKLGLATVAITVSTIAIAQVPGVRAELAKAVAAPSRPPANVARDPARHPAQTLAFFGVKPTDTVVELIPGGGWYTEILAPYLGARGTYYAAGGWAKGLDGVKRLQAANPALYGKVKLAAFPAAASCSRGVAAASS